MESNKGHGRESVMSSLRRGVLSKVPPAVLEEMRPMLSSTTTAAKPKPSRRRSLDFSLRDKTDATAKRGFRVQVPKRLLLYTIVVFFVFPLLLGLFVGTRRILRMHANYNDVEEQDKEEPPDLWQADNVEPLIDLQTVAKSAAEAMTPTETETTKPQNDGVEKEDGTQEEPNSNADNKEGEEPEPVVGEQEGEVVVSPTPIDKEPEPEGEETVEEQAADSGKHASNDGTGDANEESPSKQGDPDATKDVQNEQEEAHEEEQADQEADAEAENESPRIDEPAVPTDVDVNDTNPQTETQQKDAEAEKDAEERVRLLRGGR